MLCNKSLSLTGNFLHIVSFNVPYPPDYGGIIDVYNKLKSLTEAGIQIILHCFSYGRKPSKELEGICFKVYYYPRHSGLKYYFTPTPYIVSTRNSESLAENLLKDSFPVLFEGLHTTGLMERCKNSNKKILYRAHNIEHTYYHFLSKSEKNLFRKLFLKSESVKLRRYEKVLKFADEILCISKHETEYLEKKFGRANFIPAFHKSRNISIKEGSGDYIFYHGNLSVAENSEALKYIIRQIVSKTVYRFIVAGKDPSKKLVEWLNKYDGVELVPNPDEEKLHELISNAQINILLTFQSTGLKLKLLHSLFSGRHCIVNPMMVEGTGLEEECHVVTTSDLAVRMVKLLMGTPFTENDILKRKKLLAGYSNRENSEKIIRLLD